MNETKQKILNIGAQIVRKKGFNYTGIQEILNEAKVPKGSFYFYFKSKEDFGLELIDVYMNFFQSEMEKIMIDKSIPGLERIKSYLHFFNELFEKEGFTGGCPLGNLAQEMGDINNAFSEKVAISLNRMEKYFYNCLSDAIENGEISHEIDITQVSQFILNSWEGAIVRMKVVKSLEPLILLENMLFQNILVK